MANGDVYLYLSEPEKAVYRWLTQHKIPFTTQVAMFGGHQQIGGAIVDFLLTDLMIALRVMGTYWHSDLVHDARDVTGREKLEEAGYIVVDLWEENLTPDKIDSTMRMAIQGQEVPR